MMTSFKATSSQNARSTGSVACSSSQAARRGRSTTTAAAESNSSLIASVRWEISVISVGGVASRWLASMPRWAAMRARNSSTNRARSASSCNVSTRRWSSTALTGAATGWAEPVAAGVAGAAALGADGNISQSARSTIANARAAKLAVDREGSTIGQA